MPGLGIKLSQTQSSTAISHLPTVSACAQSSNYISLNASPKTTTSLVRLPLPPSWALSDSKKGVLTVSGFGLQPLLQLSWAAFLSPPVSLLKMLILTFSAWISKKKCTKAGLRLVRNRSRDDLNQRGAFYLAVPQLMLAAQKAEKAQRGEGEEAVIFFFPFKIKTPWKEKMLSL